MTEYFNLIWIIGSLLFGLLSVYFWIFFSVVMVKLGAKEDHFFPLFVIGFIFCLILSAVLALAPCNDFYRFIQK